MNAKNALLSLALLALCTSAQAQFTFQKADGKTISSQKSPDCKRTPTEYPTELYFTWEKDRVKIYEVEYDFEGTQVNAVTEFYIYYANFGTKNTEGEYSNRKKSFYYPVKLKENKKIPIHIHRKGKSFGSMTDYADMYFPSKKEGDAFFEKVVDKGLEMALDLDYVAPPQLVIEKYEYSADDAPAPKKRSVADITLANDSGAEIRLAYYSSPTENSFRTITISPKSTFFLKGAIGGQVYWMKLKSSNLYGKDKIAIDIVESMHETRVILAK